MMPTGPVGGITLLDLPGLLIERGYDTVQICHFHLPTRDAAYLAELRSALAHAGVTLDALLVDAGDLVDPDHADDHERWIAGWLDDAAELGAHRARVIAGQAPPTPERLAASGHRLRQLATASPVRVVTENWLDLLPSATQVRQVLEAADGEVGLLVDLGNWTGPDKYAQLAAVAALAETAHAKCHTGPAGALDVEDFRRSLRAVLDAGFAGPLALVYDGPDADEWTALAAVRAVVVETLAETRSQVGGPATSG